LLKNIYKSPITTGIGIAVFLAVTFGPKAYPKYAEEFHSSLIYFTSIGLLVAPDPKNGSEDN